MSYTKLISLFQNANMFFGFLGEGSTWSLNIHFNDRMQLSFFLVDSCKKYQGSTCKNNTPGKKQPKPVVRFVLCEWEVQEFTG